MGDSYMRRRLNEIYAGKIALGGTNVAPRGNAVNYDNLLVGGARRKRRVTRKKPAQFSQAAIMRMSRGRGYHKALSGMGTMRSGSKTIRRRRTVRKTAGVMAGSSRRRTVRCTNVALRGTNVALRGTKMGGVRVGGVRVGGGANAWITYVKNVSKAMKAKGMYHSWSDLLQISKAPYKQGIPASKVASHGKKGTKSKTSMSKSKLLEQLARCDRNILALKKRGAGISGCKY